MTDAAPETALPKRTTPTWDMELLVSAASVFTLVQVPGWLDAGYDALRPRLDLDWDLFARLLYTYGKLAAAQIVVQQGDMPFGDYARWPQPRPGLADSVQPGHYRDQSPDTLATLPTIDSAFPAGNYLTLVVPFDPKRAPASLAEACDAHWRGPDSPARRAALLDCLGRWLAVRIDGQAVPVRLRYTTDPRNGQLGALAVLPIAALPAGEHRLALRFSPSMHRPEKDPPADYLIVFWK